MNPVGTASPRVSRTADSYELRQRAERLGAESGDRSTTQDRGSGKHQEQRQR